MTAGAGGPAPGRVRMTLEAFERDAARWDQAAGQLRAAADAAAAQHLDRSVFTFAGGAAAGAYQLLQTRTVALLGEGAQNLAAIAAALRNCAATYAAQERATAERFRRIGGTTVDGGSGRRPR